MRNKAKRFLATSRFKSDSCTCKHICFLGKPTVPGTYGVCCFYSSRRLWDAFLLQFRFAKITFGALRPLLGCSWRLLASLLLVFSTCLACLSLLPVASCRCGADLWRFEPPNSRSTPSQIICFVIGKPTCPCTPRFSCSSSSRRLWDAFLLPFRLSKMLLEEVSGALKLLSGVVEMSLGALGSLLGCS